MEEIKQETQEIAKANDSETNLVNLRKKAEKLEREAMQEREARIRMEAQLEAMKHIPTHQDVEQDEEDDGDPYVAKKTLEKKMSKWEERLLKKIEVQAEAKTMQIFEKQRQQSYLNENKDFDQVLNPENLQYLIDNHPSIANSILEQPEGFSRKKLAYETLKALKKPPEAAKPSIQEQLKNNERSLYYSPTSYGNPPSASTVDFSPQGRKQAHDAMRKLIHGLTL